jgi:hypothetical protein
VPSRPGMIAKPSGGTEESTHTHTHTGTATSKKHTAHMPGNMTSAPTPARHDSAYTYPPTHGHTQAQLTPFTKQVRGA